MNHGRYEQLGDPEVLYERPRTRFVAGFLGVSNLLPATADGRANGYEGFKLSDGSTVRVPAAVIQDRTGTLALGVRPEGVLVRRDAADGYLPVEAHIIEPLGAYDIVDLQVGSQMLRARTKSGYVKTAGDRVFARLDPAQTHFFDSASGNSLGVRL